MNDRLYLLLSALAFVSAPAALLVIELFAVALLVRQMNRLGVARLGRFLYLLLMWPGVVVHEVSHAVACLVTGTRIMEMRLFSPQRTESGDYILGYVKHAVPWSRTVRVLIGTAPFFGGTAALILILNLMFPDSFRSFWRAVTESGVSGWPDFFVALRSWAGGIPVGIAAFGVWQALGLYLMVSVASYLAPSKTDLQGSALSLILVALGGCAVMGALSLLSAEMTWTAARFGRGFFSVMAAVMGVGLVLVSLAAAVTFLVTVPLALFRGPRQKPKKML